VRGWILWYNGKTIISEAGRVKMKDRQIARSERRAALNGGAGAPASRRHGIAAANKATATLLSAALRRGRR
jgi:hypothetical protein